MANLQREGFPLATNKKGVDSFSQANGLEIVAPRTCASVFFFSEGSLQKQSRKERVFVCFPHFGRGQSKGVRFGFSLTPQTSGTLKIGDTHLEVSP